MSEAREVSSSEADYERMEAEITAIRGLFRPYPKVKAIIEAIQPLARRNNAKTEGPVNLPLGPTRSGKSHLLSALLKEFPREQKAIFDDDGNFADRIPVIVVRVRKGSRKQIAEAIYRELVGRPPADVLRKSRYTEEDVVAEIKRIGTACELKLVVLDEAHQALTLRSAEGVKDIASFVKDLSNLAVFSILVVGTRKALKLINADDELQSRTTRILKMLPFAWVAEDVAIWTKLVRDIDKRLTEVFGGSSGLAEPDKAYALMVAAQGLVGHMATIVETTAHNILGQMKTGTRHDLNLEPRILWEDLEAVFDAWAPGQGRINPFSANVRPRPGAIPALGSIAPFDPEAQAEIEDEDDDGAVVIKSKKRRNHRDTTFRR